MLEPSGSFAMCPVAPNKQNRSFTLYLALNSVNGAPSMNLSSDDGLMESRHCSRAYTVTGDPARRPGIPQQWYWHDTVYSSGKLGST